MIYNLYIFNRHCDCIYYIEWHNKMNSTKSTKNPEQNKAYFSWPTHYENVSNVINNPDFKTEFKEETFIEKHKLLYGLICSLKFFAHKLTGNLS